MFKHNVQETMRVHHSKHHQAYTDRLNDAWEKLSAATPELAAIPLRQLITSPGRLGVLPPALAAAIRNHGGGYINHALFWDTMAPLGRANVAGGPAAEAIAMQWGSLETFQAAFNAAATGIFGSGWAWLVVSTAADESRGRLSIVTTANQDSAEGPNSTAILCLDVCE